MSWLLITQYKSFHPPSANLRKIHIFSFLTCFFSSDGKKRAETKIGDGEKRRGRNSGKDMRQSMLLLFASVYYTVENLCVRRRKLFDKRQSGSAVKSIEGGFSESLPFSIPILYPSLFSALYLSRDSYNLPFVALFFFNAHTLSAK